MKSNIDGKKAPNTEVETKASAEIVAEKTTETKPAEKKETAAKTAVAKEKKTTKSTAAKKKPAEKKTVKKINQKFFVQYGEIEIEQQTIVNKAKEDWLNDKAHKVSDIASLDIYVKPEEKMVYYVINGQDSGNFEI